MHCHTDGPAGQLSINSEGLNTCTPYSPYGASKGVHWRLRWPYAAHPVPSTYRTRMLWITNIVCRSCSDSATTFVRHSNQPSSPYRRRYTWIDDLMGEPVCALLHTVPQRCCDLNGCNNDWIQPDTQLRFSEAQANTPARLRRCRALGGCLSRLTCRSDSLPVRAKT